MNVLEFMVNELHRKMIIKEVRDEGYEVRDGDVDGISIFPRY